MRARVVADVAPKNKEHDALHDWLVPFLQLNKDYTAATSHQVCQVRDNSGFACGNTREF
jgi:hypothetical protein